MKDYIVKYPWQIIEDQFRPEYNEISESIFSIGNGRMGQRANFEEDYSGKTLPGSYVAGVYYPDKTRVGWWKNGYPEYFAKVINSTNWIGLHLTVNGTLVDLAQVEVTHFERRLDMRAGVLHRYVELVMPDQTALSITSQRIYSVAESQSAALSYEVKILKGQASIVLETGLDGDVSNRDSNYDEKFWEEVKRSTDHGQLSLQLRTKKTGFDVHSRVAQRVIAHENPVDVSEVIDRDKYVAQQFSFDLQEGETAILYKYVVILTSENHPVSDLEANAQALLKTVSGDGFEKLLQDQEAGWAKIWRDSDIQIEGDIAAQQAIRFNIFQLYQTYTGEDDRLNIGPKGFTGEKYGGVTYWDTEAYCLPFYMATTKPEIARNLLIYRYKHLEKAIENAAKLGFKDGAALYPMVTINGEECHNEWEITFEEIHRNGAIAFAIYNYVRYTGDDSYLQEYGLEVLMGIARFWAQRVNWSGAKQQYVMLGVTGPNEYENNVNNNWYTNRIAAWCLQYTADVIGELASTHPERLQRILEGASFVPAEKEKWQHIVANMYYPEDAEGGVYLQQDGFLDKELIPVSDLPASERPLNQKWSWDRILRSCFIKQADVLQGLYFLEDQYDLDTIRRNYDFYEPMTVHESSLSPCVHAIIAAKLGKEDKAYEFYLRTSRLDLDDYNNDTEDGLHITSMAGTWMTIVEGFAGMRVRDGKLHFQPILPKQWNSYSFRINFRGADLQITVNREGVRLTNAGQQAVQVVLADTLHTIHAESKLDVSQPMVANA
ncbi:glycoside hydrolase family 65 protein [Sphingobacterium sp. lm-10]|uniref:glycoside hydrolase family 65 protein n=1 Tax=Sphingobacterium sp. lm-10 TaxID=2944904 RepID=UPI002021ECFA|nr:glycoside hydrolase family 65 protein [Sphingobacterium sp. lm-10]MCL7989200.1 glycoside hydrolase family 65 protein [Sphingobacterium sp. lm-10]